MFNFIQNLVGKIGLSYENKGKKTNTNIQEINIGQINFVPHENVNAETLISDGKETLKLVRSDIDSAALTIEKFGKYSKAKYTISSPVNFLNGVFYDI